jgi:PmbA protein
MVQGKGSVMNDAVALLTREEAERAAAEAFRHANGTPAELLIEWQASGSTRFSNNAITQNVSSRTESVTVRLVDGKRQGKAETTTLSPSAIARAVERAKRVVGHGHDDEDTLPLVAPPQEHRKVDAFSTRTAETGPDQRARIVQRLVDRCRSEGLTGSGLVTMRSHVVSYANSTGLTGYHTWTEASASLTAAAGDGVEGWAEMLNVDVERIDTDWLMEEAVSTALSGRNPGQIPTGTYHVVLAPAAVSELMLFWTWLGSGAKAYQEDRSYVSGKLGQKLFSSLLTVSDDAYHPMAPGLPFDFEGMPRQRVLLVDKGVPCAVVHDRITARRAGVQSTGHSLPQPNTSGPMALNVVVEGTDKPLDELVKDVDQGLLVKRFHYGNVLEPKKLSLTGMTRSGLFRIEGGEVVGPVKNMRFTDDLVSVFSTLEDVGRAEPTGKALFGGGFVVPPMRVREFSFTSGTEF